MNNEQQQPVAWWNPTKDTVSTDPIHRNNPDCVPLYTTPPQRERIVFPTMLRRMWSGSEVQQWLDDNVNGGKHEPRQHQDICDND